MTVDFIHFILFQEKCSKCSSKLQLSAENVSSLRRKELPALLLSHDLRDHSASLRCYKWIWPYAILRDKKVVF